MSTPREKKIPDKLRFDYVTQAAYKENKRFYNECTEEVIAFCEERGISCHIKAKTMTDE